MKGRGSGSCTGEGGPRGKPAWEEDSTTGRERGAAHQRAEGKGMTTDKGSCHLASQQEKQKHFACICEDFQPSYIIRPVDPGLPAGPMLSKTTITKPEEINESHSSVAYDNPIRLHSPILAGVADVGGGDGWQVHH